MQCLYCKRVISPETFGWIIEVVSPIGYKLDVRPYQTSAENIVKTFSYLKEHCKRYYLVYRLILGVDRRAVTRYIEGYGLVAPKLMMMVA